MPAPKRHYEPTMSAISGRVSVSCARIEKPCVVTVPREVAQAFVKLHHSTQPYINPRGLLYTLGVMYGGKLVAVMTANTPTARFRNRGAASMLVAKAIDLLPQTGRGGTPGCLLITYSLIDQAGTTYAALVDKGLRPVEYVEGQRPTGARRAAGAAALQTTPKIRWEAGPAAMAPDWSLLRGKLPPDKLEARAARLVEFVVARAQRAILLDARRGLIPRRIRTLRGLSAYVDQNTYLLNRGGNLDREVVALGRLDGLQPMLDFLNTAQIRVDDWLRGGALAQAR